MSILSYYQNTNLYATKFLITMVMMLSRVYLIFGLVNMDGLASLLKQADMYGYQLVQEMERQALGALSMQEGALYPVLYKLQDAGYVSSEKVLVGKRMTRVYYHLEPEGEQYLSRLLADYRAVVDGVLRIAEGVDPWKK